MHIGLFNLYIVQLNKFIDYMVGGRTIKIDSSKFYACDFFFTFRLYVLLYTHDTIGQIDRLTAKGNTNIQISQLQ